MSFATAVASSFAGPLVVVMGVVALMASAVVVVVLLSVRKSAPRGFATAPAHWLQGTPALGMTDPADPASGALSIAVAPLMEAAGVDTLLVYKFLFPVLLTRDAALVRRVLVTHNNLYGKPDGILSGYRAMRPILGTGLVLSSGETWKAHRRIVNPAFAPTYLRSLVPSFSAVTVELCSILDRRPADVDVDLASEVAKATVDIIGVTAFGAHFGCLDDANAELPRAIFAMLEQQRKILREPLTPLLDRSGMSEYHNGIRVLRELANSVIKRSRRAQQPQPDALASEDDDNKPDTPSSKSLLAYLLASQAQDLRNGLVTPTMSDENLIDQTMTFLLAGHETTATTVGAALNLLLRHPSVLAKAVAEVDEVLRARDAPITYESLQQLTYLDLVIKETLRVAPAIFAVGRSPLVDDVVDAGDHDGAAAAVIPKGARVVVSIHCLHHNKRYWGEDADRFVPERWEDERTQTAAQVAYLPFAAGPRNCVGQLFAQLEARVILAQLLRHFTLRLSPSGPDMTKVRGDNPWAVIARDPLFVRIARRD